MYIPQPLHPLTPIRQQDVVPIHTPNSLGSGLHSPLHLTHIPVSSFGLLHAPRHPSRCSQRAQAAAPSRPGCKYQAHHLRHHRIPLLSPLPPRCAQLGRCMPPSKRTRDRNRMATNTIIYIPLRRSQAGKTEGEGN